MNDQTQSDALKFLYSLEFFGIKLGLENTYVLLDFLENPQNNFKSIHIAGTNGKGSTAAFIASILQECGLKVGLYTSPHLMNFTERIKINGKEISENDLIKYTQALKEIIVKTRSTFFEATTCMAFKYFSDNGVDIAVIETGLGGRLDATNILTPDISIITDIGIDHIEQLGNSIESIANEKGGIIKEGIPCITGTENTNAVEVLQKIANENHSQLININKTYSKDLIKIGLKFMDVKVKSSLGEVYEIQSELIGNHQISNICCGLAAMTELNKSGSFKITKENIINGIRNVRKNTNIHGRIELLRENPFLILDVGHNVDSTKKLIETLRNFKFDKIHLILGMMKDKDYREVVKMFSNFVDISYAVQVASERALDSRKIYDEFIKNNIISENPIHVETALKKAFKAAGKNDLILITGSHYHTGEALKILLEEKLINNS